ncbi:hypothetical protein G7090_19360 [Leclercia sp. 29361]|uniref:hypothetical protein n=1 Tax=Leclercia sp. 29361 TaxID=2714951 RepID=UPI00140A5BB6|nr:hypothetical protein [Leclercia sp. 29361]QIK15403.1 hypothetical protein G7090_19360 [Leclercia sp. 29361]
MAILGHIFARFPAFFIYAPTALKTQLEIFADGPGNAHIYILHFPCLVGIKRGARLIQKSTRRFFVSPLPAG